MWLTGLFLLLADLQGLLWRLVEQLWLRSLLWFRLFHKFLQSFFSLSLEEIEEFAESKATATAWWILNEILRGSSDPQQLLVLWRSSFLFWTQNITRLYFIPLSPIKKHRFSIPLNLILQSLILQLQLSVSLYLFRHTDFFFLLTATSFSVLLIESQQWFGMNHCIFASAILQCRSAENWRFVEGNLRSHSFQLTLQILNPSFYHIILRPFP